MVHILTIINLELVKETEWNILATAAFSWEVLEDILDAVHH